MLNSIVTIICISLSRLSCFVFQKPENLDKRPSKKGLPGDSREVMGAIRLS